MERVEVDRGLCLRSSKVPSYAPAMRCPVCDSSTKAFGTDLAVYIFCLRTCFAMSGTDLAYGTVCLRACSPVLTSHVVLSAYAPAMRCPVPTWCICYQALDQKALERQFDQCLEQVRTRLLCDVRY
eukprot:3778079-Rhodomonas_salina.2